MTKKLDIEKVLAGKSNTRQIISELRLIYMRKVLQNTVLDFIKNFRTLIYDIRSIIYAYTLSLIK